MDRFWLCDDALTSTADDPFEVLPDGCVEIVFALGKARGRMLAFGTETQGRLFPTQPSICYMGMRLRPARLGGLIDARADSLTDRHDELDRLDEMRADDLLAQLHEAGSVEAQVAALEQPVRQAWRAQSQLAGLDRTVAAVQRHARDLRVEQLVEHASLSRTCDATSLRWPTATSPPGDPTMSHFYQAPSAPIRRAIATEVTP